MTRGDIDVQEVNKIMWTSTSDSIVAEAGEVVVKSQQYVTDKYQ